MDSYEDIFERKKSAVKFKEVFFRLFDLNFLYMTVFSIPPGFDSRIDEIVYNES
jgi:hypothetical protein